MKKIISFIFILTSITGCRVPEYNYTYHAPQTYYTDISIGWNLLFPEYDEWTIGKKLYLEKYYTSRELSELREAPSNILYAVHKLDSSNTLAVYINFSSAFQIFKYTRGNEVFFDKKEQWCIESSINRIAISMNNVNVSFDNCSVYFEIDDKKLMGHQFLSTRQTHYEQIIKTCQNYQLGTPAALITWQQVRNPVRQVSFLTFNYLFELSCRDMHNAVFVIDGFTYKGEKVPPLRFRLKYFNPEEVPEYVGDGSEVRRLLGS